MARGRLVSFEGGEGSGKSTQAAIWARARGALLTREPGGSRLGERLREIVLAADGQDAIDARSETLIMLAARAQHVVEVVSPELEAGRDVVTDRFSDSTLAYQGYGRGLDLAELRRMCEWSAGGLWPDAVVLVDVMPDVARTRRAGPTDRMEQAGVDFHARVHAGFHRLAQDEPERFVIVDGVGSVDEVAARVAESLATRGLPIGHRNGGTAA